MLQMFLNTEKITYRGPIRPGGLHCFQIEIKESNMLVLADKKLSKETEEALIGCRRDIEQYIYRHPDFRVTFKPFPPEKNMPAIVKAMADAAQEVGVGPMAAVAGAIAEFVGKKLLEHCRQVIVENGGDIFIKTKKRRTVGIYAGNSPLSEKIALEIEPQNTPLGICCSAGTFGRSQSLGQADAVVVLSPSASLADAAATAVGNIVKDGSSIAKGLGFLKKFPLVRGGIIIKDKKMGVWGQVKVVRGA